MTVIRPIWTYGVELWGSTKPSNSSRIQSLQSKILRKILNAPYFVTNKLIHTDLNVPYVADLAQTRYLSLHSKLRNHSNPLVSRLASHSIPDNPPRCLKRIWPRDLLILYYLQVFKFYQWAVFLTSTGHVTFSIIITFT